MLGTVNSKYNSGIRDAKEDRFILESVLDVEEVLPGSDEELDDIIDTESIPADVYARVNKAIDGIIGDGDIGDDEIEDLLDDDGEDDEDPRYAELDAVISEAANAWYDDEDIGHPNINRRNGTKDQPRFAGTAMVH